MKSITSKIVLSLLVIVVAVCVASRADSPSSSAKNQVIVAGGTSAEPPDNSFSIDATTCYTNFVIVIADLPFIQLVQSADQPTCEPAFQPSNSNSDTGTYTGTCMLANGTACNNLTGGTAFDIILRSAQSQATQIGTATLYCYNSGSGGCSNAVIKLMVPAQANEVSYVFYATCEGSCCALSVCQTNAAGGTQ